MRTFVLSVSLAVTLVVCAHASNAAVQDATEIERVRSADEAQVTEAGEMEEVTVLGRMSTVQLEKAVVRARREFWDLYNSLTDSDEYRVVCEKVAATGTRIKKLQCAPAYYHEKARQLTYERSTQNLRRGAGGTIGMRPPSHLSFVGESTVKKREADAHMIALIEEHPSLRRKFEYLVKANEAYEQSKEAE